MTLSTYICLCGFLACLAALAAMKARHICRDVWRSFAGRRGAFAALAAFAVIATICAQKPGPPVITVDSFLADAGSYATNDVLHVAVTNAPAYATVDFSSCPVLVYARPRGLSDAPEWEELLPRRTFSELPADYAIEDATNYNYLVYLDYVPPSPVHTNGVFELRGFVVGEVESGGVESEGVNSPTSSLTYSPTQLMAGFATSTIVDNREIVPIKYLESTGTQWIKSGVMSEYPKIHAGLWYDRYRTAYTRFFGNYSDEQHNCIRLILQSSANDRAWVTPGTKAGGSINVPFAKSEWHNVYLDCTAKSCTIDGELFTTPNVGTRYVDNICIFADSRGPSANAVIRISFFKIWDENGELVRDFIPVRVGRVGYLFDRVSGEYLPFGNKGTGSFILGPDIKE